MQGGITTGSGDWGAEKFTEMEGKMRQSCRTPIRKEEAAMDEEYFGTKRGAHKKTRKQEICRLKKRFAVGKWRALSSGKD